MTDEPCQFLDWDTNFFEYRIARAARPTLDDNYLKAVYSWCEANAIQCLYFLADYNDPNTVRLAEEHRFRLVEVRLNMERWMRDWNPETRPRASQGILIRSAREDDIPVLQEIARTSYVNSRFYFDPHFSEQKWQEFYATWVKKSCQVDAQLALAAELDNQVVGYITGKVSPDGREGQYELTGVREWARNTGVGQELFRSGLDWYARAGVERVWLATQGRNIPTQRMVQRNGFITFSCQLYYHKWFTNDNP